MEGLNKTNGLINWSTNRQIIHRDLSDDPLAVDDKQAPQTVAEVLEVDAVVLWDLVSQIGEERDVDVAEAALVKNTKVKIQFI